MNYQLKKEFNLLREKISDIECINDGGCGFVAYVLYKWLLKRGIKSEIVYGYQWSGWSFRSNDSYIKSKGKEGELRGCTHAFIKLNGKYFDCSEKISISDRFTYHHKVPVKYVLKSILNDDNWNDDFDRETGVKELETISGIKIPNFKK